LYKLKKNSSRPKIPVLCNGQTNNHAINGLKYQCGATPANLTSLTAPISPHINISYDRGSGSLKRINPTKNIIVKISM